MTSIVTHYALLWACSQTRHFNYCALVDGDVRWEGAHTDPFCSHLLAESEISSRYYRLQKPGCGPFISSAFLNHLYSGAHDITRKRSVGWRWLQRPSEQHRPQKVLQVRVALSITFYLHKSATCSVDRTIWKLDSGALVLRTLSPSAGRTTNTSSQRFCTQSGMCDRMTKHNVYCISAVFTVHPIRLQSHQKWFFSTLMWHRRV